MHRLSFALGCARLSPLVLKGSMRCLSSPRTVLHAEKMLRSLTSAPLTAPFFAVLHAEKMLRSYQRTAHRTVVCRHVPLTVQGLVDRCMQMHGAKGLSQDTPLFAAFCGARWLRIADGPDEVSPTPHARPRTHAYTRTHALSLLTGTHQCACLTEQAPVGRTHTPHRCTTGLEAALNW